MCPPQSTGRGTVGQETPCCCNKMARWSGVPCDFGDARWRLGLSSCVIVRTRLQYSAIRLWASAFARSEITNHRTPLCALTQARSQPEMSDRDSCSPVSSRITVCVGDNARPHIYRDAREPSAELRSTVSRYCTVRIRASSRYVRLYSLESHGAQLNVSRAKGGSLTRRLHELM